MNKDQHPTYKEQIIRVLESEGGSTSLNRLYEMIDTTFRNGKTCDATIRNILQRNPNIFYKIKPGIWGLVNHSQNSINNSLNKTDTSNEKTELTHGYVQGLLVMIGKILGFKTYVPQEDKHRKFGNVELKDIIDFAVLPDKIGTWSQNLRTIDVIWLDNEGEPTHLYEVEHTTDIHNSLIKFHENSLLNVKFFIVADKKRENEYFKKLNKTIFNKIKNRVEFLNYTRVEKRYELLKEEQPLKW